MHCQINSWALGSALEMLDSILTNKVQNGFAIIRPPGHHASHDEPNGGCYFNNAAICAKFSVDKYKLKRFLIVDWDVVSCIYHSKYTLSLFICRYIMGKVYKEHFMTHRSKF